MSAPRKRTQADKPDPFRDQVVLLLINGKSNEAAEEHCAQQGKTLEEARRIVADARKRITIAAKYVRDEEIGKAVMRLEDLYAKSITAKDIKTALQAQRELNRLLSLYADTGRTNSEPSDRDSAALRQQLELISAYLLPLKLEDASYPLQEHARIASELIRNAGLAGK